MKPKVIINPNEFQKQHCLNHLTKLTLKNVLGTERRAQVGLYCEPAWNIKNKGLVSYSLDYLITLNENN